MRAFCVVAILFLATVVSAGQAPPTPLPLQWHPAESSYHLVTVIDGQVSIQHGLTEAQCDEILNRLGMKRPWFACPIDQPCYQVGNRGWCLP